MVYQREIQLQTTGHRQMHDLTGEIAQIVSASKARTGVVHIFNVGSTGAVGTIEFEALGVRKTFKGLPAGRPIGAW